MHTAIIVFSIGPGEGGDFKYKGITKLKFEKKTGAYVPRKFLLLFKGENTHFKMRASLFLPTTPDFNLCPKIPGWGRAPPPEMPRGGKRTTAPPHVYAPACNIIWLLKLGITILIHNKDDIEFFTEFSCLLRHSVHKKIAFKSLLLLRLRLLMLFF